MHKLTILPRLAVTGICKNRIVYLPYLLTGVVSVFIMFIFSSILHNNLINTLPHAGYAGFLLMVGRVLLGIILLPFLSYANGFLIKRRKREIGLYHILGMEKRHIAVILLIETQLLLTAALAGGIVCGLVFSKLSFVLLLNMTKLTLDAEFVFVGKAFQETVLFFVFVYVVNLMDNLITVGRTNPIDLLGSARKGEKEPKHLLLPMLAGMLLLGWGYAISFHAKVNSMIYINFFLAVLLVVAGTYLLFTAGSIVILRQMRRRKNFYYRADNFITVSGMLYRMKKNAGSLSNICIFSTMAIITLTCTVSLFFGQDGIAKFSYPNDVEIAYEAGSMQADTLKADAAQLADACGVQLTDIVWYRNYKTGMEEDGKGGFVSSRDTMYGNGKIDFRLLTLKDLERLEGRQESLEEGEVILFCTGEDFTGDTLVLNGVNYSIAGQPAALRTFSKSRQNQYLKEYCIFFNDDAAREACISQIRQTLGYDNAVGRDRMIIMLDGEEVGIQTFLTQLTEYCQGQSGYADILNGIESRKVNISMLGGLLFIGLFFCLIFGMCLLLIMYYKQVSEGYEDQSAFGIMQKVGMSDREIRRTIQKQILIVFMLPVCGAILHTLAGAPLMRELLGTIQLFDSELVYLSLAAVSLIFLLFYAASYLFTARTYYRIVKGQEQK